ncbi:hypothetical protein COCNU_10G000030 [Cocos nucifera]|uniref:Uncharacterized protein n=1 Tax=Cocos nucifera TaxID=13894 RepID=A0A8K0ILB3_COCNU|nr:hypothetical protein COCNU_10G000030 [Cocos nucifera]
MANVEGDLGEDGFEETRRNKVGLRFGLVGGGGMGELLHCGFGLSGGVDLVRHRRLRNLGVDGLLPPPLPEKKLNLAQLRGLGPGLLSAAAVSGSRWMDLGRGVGGVVGGGERALFTQGKDGAG